MDYYGQLPKYPINRPLTEAERADQLQQKKRVEIDPHYNLSVIRINSTYLEIVDKYYAWKGGALLISVVVILIASIALGTVAALVINKWDMATIENRQGSLGALFVAALVFLPLIIYSIWLALRETFTYTHYPIRLNRKTRMVYVFRRDGTILSVPWDDLFFTLNKATRDWNVRGHVLDVDGVTVKETFAFPMYDDLKSELLLYWEFVRRYMEDGPAKLIGSGDGQVNICHPIADRKESFGWSMHLIYSHFAPVPIMLWIFSPFLTLVGLARYLAHLTCDVPEWPKRINDSCVIEPGDPYERDARHNSPNLKRWA